MRILSRDQVRALDARAIAGGVSGVELMCRACQGLLGAWRTLLGTELQSVLVLVGPGNNGGDGLGLARLLRDQGHRVRVWLAVPPERVRGDAAEMLRAWQESGGALRVCDQESDWQVNGCLLPAVDWVVDALLGTGSTRAPEGTMAAAVRWMRALRRQARVLAVDLPTGWDADTGIAFEESCFAGADLTLTLGALKPGLCSPEAASACGPVYGVDLGVESAWIAVESRSGARVMDAALARELLPPRPVNAHKGSLGQVAVWGGGEGTCGAPLLAATAALQSGAGRVTAFLPEAAAISADVARPQIMVLGHRAFPRGADVTVAGPGLTFRDEKEAESERQLLLTLTGPLVLDAGALRLFAGCPEPLKLLKGPCFLTPHPGEAAALLGCRAEEVQADREGALTELQRLTGATVVLKGHQTRVLGPDGIPWLNVNGNAGLATAGTGDVLAGVLGALLAQGVPAAAAAPLAVFLHAQAGDRLMLQRRGIAFTAEELRVCLPR